MRFAYDVLTHTPLWVFPLFAYLVWQGIRAMRPRTTRLSRALIVPAVFIVWGRFAARSAAGLRVAAGCLDYRGARADAGRVFDAAPVRARPRDR